MIILIWEGTLIIPSTVNIIEANALFKSSISNSKLTKIINKTGKSFNWQSVMGGLNSANFETGVVKTNHGDITITKE